MLTIRRRSLPTRVWGGARSCPYRIPLSIHDEWGGGGANPSLIWLINLLDCIERIGSRPAFQVQVPIKVIHDERSRSVPFDHLCNHRWNIDRRVAIGVAADVLDAFTGA